ncbi:hypothetical protein M011DRAFT_463360 [Sporormia fimetaria CBS 119925]|uniref:Uncharacterized protein n=1 Tax=Sporormia fimetaria CBS 119925 TaxID=1340428 RepID=A0A6A6VML6_9PLEO|nr:hypothetical protein M011DRAFT_463360 [Sporormia fimetaria CBS 119925]
MPYIVHTDRIFDHKRSLVHLPYSQCSSTSLHTTPHSLIAPEHTLTLAPQGTNHVPYLHTIYEPMYDEIPATPLQKIKARQMQVVSDVIVIVLRPASRAKIYTPVQSTDKMMIPYRQCKKTYNTTLFACGHPPYYSTGAKRLVFGRSDERPNFPLAMVVCVVYYQC